MFRVFFLGVKRHGVEGFMELLSGAGERWKQRRKTAWKKGIAERRTFLEQLYGQKARVSNFFVAYDDFYDPVTITIT